MSGISAAASAPVQPPRVVGTVQWPVVGFALIAAAVLAHAVAGVAAANVVALLGVGLLLGVALYHAAFGFTSAFRVFLADRQGAGLRAQMIMLAVACTLFFPALAGGNLFGTHVTGNVSPLNISLVVGAFLFGIGMQLGAGCASGTLFAVGGGSVRMVLTLVFFIVGSVIGVAQLPFWTSLPGLPPVSLVARFGWPVALAGNLAVFALLWLVVAAMERRRHGVLEPIAKGGHVLRGPWPLAAGAVVLAALNFATLALAGRPWGITSAFGLWGAKLLALGGIDVSFWGGWTAPAQHAALVQPVLTDITSVMNFGIMLGALLAAGLAGRFVLWRKIPLGHVAGSVIGGLLLGYGARLAYGCNIGAFFSGVASGSLHGWVWVACALAGSFVGLKLRPLFGMAVERRLTAC
jgi:uncharacterized membrane protein YedE/YeeE